MKWISANIYEFVTHRGIVPVDVPDEELFWQRYYFRFFEIEEEEKRRQKLVQGTLIVLF